MSPVSISVSSFVSSVLPMPGSSVTRPSRTSCSTDTDASRTVRAGGAVGEHAVLHGAVELVEVGELVEGGGDLCVGHSL